MTYRQSEAPPEVDRSILVVGLNGKVFGLDRLTGQLCWTNGLTGGGGSGEVFLALRYGALVVSAGGMRVYSLDYRTGATRWVVATQGAGRASILIEPEYIVVAKGGYLDCFDHAGHTLWSQPLTGQGTGSVALGLPGNVVQADNIGQ